MISGGKDDFDGIAHPVARGWFKRARDFGHMKDSWCEVRPGTAEWEAWEAYFEDLGWRPVTFTREFVRSSAARSWTAPCRWPSDFEHPWGVGCDGR